MTGTNLTGDMKTIFMWCMCVGHCDSGKGKLQEQTWRTIMKSIDTCDKCEIN